MGRPIRKRLGPQERVKVYSSKQRYVGDIKVYSGKQRYVGDIEEAWLTRYALKDNLIALMAANEVQHVRVTGYGSKDLYIPLDAFQDDKGNLCRPNPDELVIKRTWKEIQCEEDWRKLPDFAADEKAQAHAIDLYKLHHTTAWSRVQTAATLGGWYTLRNSTSPPPVPAWSVLVFGALLLLLIMLLMLRDWQHIDKSEQRAGEWLPIPAFQGVGPWKWMQQATKWVLKGRRLATSAVGLLIIVDVGLALYSWASMRPDTSLTAAQVVEGLRSEGVAIGEIRHYTGESDPEQRLGRPNQYQGRSDFRPEGLPTDGSVEVFASQADLSRRKTYLEEANWARSTGREYYHTAGRVLLRLPHSISSEQDLQYMKALTRIVKSPPPATPTRR